MRVGVVIVAGGTGKRFRSFKGGVAGNAPKQFLLLNKKPLLYWAIKAFEKQRSVGEIVLVLPKKWVNEGTRLTKKHKLKKVKKSVVGGKERFDSVRIGIRELSDKCEVVLIHDGVRPLVGSKTIAGVINAASRYGSSIAAIPVQDTVKETAKNNLIKGTVPRAKLWLAQTPQGFRKEIAGTLYKGKISSKITDDAQIAEEKG